MALRSSFLRRTAVILNVLVTVLLILSAWLPFVNPQQLIYSGILGLLFPVLWCINLLFIPLWIIRKKRYFWIPVFGMLLSFKATHNTFAIQPLQDTAGPRQFTLMTFNTSSMGLRDYKEDSLLKKKIYLTLKKSSPDILCLQEFYTNTRKGYTDNISAIQKQLNYPFYSFTDDKTKWDTWHYGIIVFSRYPVIRAKKILCGESPVGSGSSILQADIVVHGDTVRVLTAQLKSYMFKSRDPHIVGKAMHTIRERSKQSPLLASLIAESPYPTVVCGDFNDTPVSFTYNTISRHMQDAFLERSWGLGRTLAFLSPTLRIDYILTQSSFNIHTYNTFKEKGFEHFPVMAGLSLKRN